MDHAPHERRLIDYWNEVDSAMVRLFGINTGDAGIEADRIAAAQEEEQTAEAFARAFGEKYGLTLQSEWGQVR